MTTHPGLFLQVSLHPGGKSYGEVHLASCALIRVHAAHVVQKPTFEQAGGTVCNRSVPAAYHVLFPRSEPI